MMYNMAPSAERADRIREVLTRLIDSGASRHDLLVLLAQIGLGEATDPDLIVSTMGVIADWPQVDQSPAPDLFPEPELVTEPAFDDPNAEWSAVNSELIERARDFNEWQRQNSMLSEALRQDNILRLWERKQPHAEQDRPYISHPLMTPEPPSILRPKRRIGEPPT